MGHNFLGAFVQVFIDAIAIRPASMERIFDGSVPVVWRTVHGNMTRDGQDTYKFRILSNWLYVGL